MSTLNQKCQKVRTFLCASHVTAHYRSKPCVDGWQLGPISMWNKWFDVNTDIAKIPVNIGSFRTFEQKFMISIHYFVRLRPSSFSNIESAAYTFFFSFHLQFRSLFIRWGIECICVITLIYVYDQICIIYYMYLFELHMSIDQTFTH